eukprot:CAMPEP_0197455366 /NCGR_PEP_ID=MMETSP1175-20131217/40594_1 /TAXON_ID=1003142 /ORGANISM="Triceratium dubium, Strain CCMP147" /LENGTH=30 /DNA_ID= /DNA_START= /DNA_END= /DNA_ORIENTATION=
MSLPTVHIFLRDGSQSSGAVCILDLITSTG